MKEVPHWGPPNIKRNSVKLPAAAWLLVRSPMPVKFCARCRTKRDTLALKVGVGRGAHMSPCVYWIVSKRGKRWGHDPKAGRSSIVEQDEMYVVAKMGSAQNRLLRRCPRTL